MNKLTALIEAAKEAAEKEPLVVDEDISIHGSTSWCRTQRKFITLANPATILELCALLEKAEEALERMCIVTTSGAENGMLNMGSLEGRTTFYDLLRTEKVTATEAIAAIKQWKEQT